MDEEPIGPHEPKSYVLPPVGTHPEPKGAPGGTNWWGSAVTRKQMASSMAVMLLVVISVMIALSQKEARDIASVRAEQRASSEIILQELRANDRSAVERSRAGVERSNKINANLNQLLGKTDTLIKELSHP